MKKHIPRNKQKLYYIKWFDAHSSGAWYNPGELDNLINEEYCVVENIGWIVFEDDKQIVMISRRLAWDKTENPKEHEFGAVQKIPKTWIVERIEIKLKKKGKK